MIQVIIKVRAREKKLIEKDEMKETGKKKGR